MCNCIVFKFSHSIGFLSCVSYHVSQNFALIANYMTYHNHNHKLGILRFLLSRYAPARIPKMVKQIPIIIITRYLCFLLWVLSVISYEFMAELFFSNPGLHVLRKFFFPSFLTIDQLLIYSPHDRCPFIHPNSGVCSILLSLGVTFSSLINF